MALNAPPPSAGDRAEAASFAGLCAACRHLQVLRSRRSTFVRCGLADRQLGFQRYPQLPVYFCRGHEPVEEEPA